MRDTGFRSSRRGFLKSAGLAAIASGAIGDSRRLEAQSVAWKQPGNNNHIIELQERDVSPTGGDVALDYFGHCAFRITSPSGVKLLVDPWRNDPSGAWGLWYPKPFPRLVVDIGLSTHAHFDHDALDAIDAVMLLDRMVGDYSFADISITAVADKHACQAPGWYKWTDVLAEFGQNACPPDNPGHMDMSMYLIETGGLRILMWGDNRHNPPEAVWERLGKVDVLTLPVDGSQHILSYEQADAIVERLSPSIVIPTHYLCEDVSSTLSTLQPADEWVMKQKTRTTLDQGQLVLNRGEIQSRKQDFLYFGSNTSIEGS